MGVDRKKPLIKNSETWTNIKYELTKLYHLTKRLLDVNKSLRLSISQTVLLSNIKHD